MATLLIKKMEMSIWEKCSSDIDIYMCLYKTEMSHFRVI